MWLNVGIPALVLIGLVTVRVVYYHFWRRHWDRRPARPRATPEAEVIVVPPFENKRQAAQPPPTVNDHQR